MLEAEVRLGTLINNRYEIQKVLGQGGFGRTYLADDKERFDELCVLKEFVPSNGAEYASQKSRELFEREAKALYQLNHPQIPKFLAWFTQMGRLFIVQEYIDGKTYAKMLSDRQQQGQAFSEAEVIQWLKDLLPVLTYLHERKMIHRDISPDNIILPNFQSQPVLIDFGLVKETMTQIWAVKTDIFGNSGQSFVGKIGYAPMEQLRMGQCYPSSDLYALGVTALVLLTGKQPNVLMDLRNLEWRWRSYVKVSDQLGEILDKTLAEKIQDRYQSAQEVLADLQFLNQPGAIALPASVMEFHIEIDQAKMERQIAEIEEMDFFQQLQKEVEELKNGDSSAPEPQTEVLPASTPPGQTTAVHHEFPQAEKPPKLEPAFVDHCRRKLADYVGPMANYIIEETLEQYPDISATQLLETLTAEIPNSQQAQQFRNSVATDPAFKQKTGNSPQYGVSQGASRSSQLPVLRLIHSSGQEFRLPGEKGYIGRSSQTSSVIPEIDLAGIPNEGVVSRTHARIYWDSSRKAYMLVDNNSQNGTYLNGNRLYPGFCYRLKPGDSLQLGKSNLICFTVAI